MAREESMITKKKTKPVTYEEPIQKKKKKKKKKAREAENEPASEAQSHTEVKNKGLVKHKRKHYLTEEIVPDPGEDHVAESSVKKKKKKQKLKFKDENITDAPISAENEEMGKDKLGQNCLVPNDENAESESFKKKRKKKKDKQILHLTEEVDQEELEMESADKSSMLKKKKRVSATQENVLISTLPETIERDTEEDNNDIKKKKKKKKRKKKAEIIQSDQSENKTEKEECRFVEHNITSIDNKKKKKKKLDRTLDSEEGTLSKNTIEADKCTMKNSKKRPTPECEVPKEISTSKKKKSAQVKQEGAQEVNEDDPEVEIVSVKKGNKDEVKIDKIRRQALQDEVDRESGKIKSKNVGQWQTATFDNPEQKMKFLRLLGGFKKSSQLTPLSPALTEKPIMALSRTGEETLKQNLLSEFEKAIDLKQNRGMGLGFQPTTKKTFSIDKNKSTSIKFDY